MLQTIDLWQEMEELLDRTQEALVAGELMALSPLAEAMDRLASSLGPVDPAIVDRSRLKAERNGQLLQAATRGVRAARGRIAEILAEPALTTYDARGQKGSLGQVSNQPPKRF